jgi:hypothetical protein
LGALRTADGKPLSSPDVVTFVMKERGIDKSVRRTIFQRVRSNLRYLEWGGKISRTDKGKSVRWARILQAKCPLF